MVIGAFIGWSLLVLVAAGPSVDDSLLGIEGLDRLWIVVVCVSLFVSLMVLVLLNPFSREFTPPPRKRRRWGVYAFMILVLLVWRPNLIDSLQNLELFDPEESADVVGSAVPVERPEVVEPETVAQVSDILLVIAALTAVVVVWWVARSRFGPEPDIESSVDDGLLTPELAAAVDQASWVLDGEDDPRIAVIKAYAILEVTLADHGMARNLAETPREHMQRSLAGLRLHPSPLLDLADMYELARFAERPMTSAHRERAAALLSDAQHELMLAESVAGTGAGSAAEQGVHE